MQSKDKILLENSLVFILLRGYTPDMQRQYAYVAIRGDLIEQFKKATLQETFDIGKYGLILKSGLGDPTPDEMREMEEQYNFDHSKMIVVDS